VERRGQVTGIEVVRVNGKPEELDDLDGRRQPLVGGTSRISREAYVRFCERLGVQFPGPTRRWETGRRSGVSARAHPRLYTSRFLSNARPNPTRHPRNPSRRAGGEERFALCAFAPGDRQFWLDRSKRPALCWRQARSSRWCKGACAPIDQGLAPADG
jgi:hypothetical protein